MSRFSFKIVQNGKYGYFVEKFNSVLKEWEVAIPAKYDYNSYSEALDAAVILVDTLNCTGQYSY